MNQQIDTEMNKTVECPPILFLIFNRPEQSQQVIACIRNVRPAQLFIAADGPRQDKPRESELSERTRKIVLENIDWDCEVKTLFRDKNLGCRKAVSSAITWFFENVEAGIILEDDCYPELSFFPFCAELLGRYNNDCRIGMISGNNFSIKLYDAQLSYSFSRHGLIWGWATWKRAWDNYLGSVCKI